MERPARELKAAVGADGGSHSEAVAVRSDASFDVAEVILQGAHFDREFVAEIVKHPLLIAETLDDLLSTRQCRAHGSLVVAGAVGGLSGPPVASHSRTGRPST